MNLADYIRDVPDFPKPGVLFKDITPLLAHPPAFRAAVELLAEACRGLRVDALAAAEARGFLFAAPMALQMNLPLIPLRKPGKLPFESLAHHYDLEYGSAALHMHTDAIEPGQRVMLIDDVLATGGTMVAGASLIGRAGGVVAGYAFLIELNFLGGRARLAPHEPISLIRYD